jgi:type I restriction enzyme, S subunit
MNAAQLLTHFYRVSEAPDAIPLLRRFILDLAVRGKLVQQDPNDEPASELLKRISSDKAQLVSEGKIKAQEPQPAIKIDEINYALPQNWKATRIGDLLTVIRGASPRPKGDPKYFATERTPYHWIKISDIRKYSKDRVLYDTDEFLTEAGVQKSVLLPKGTLVVTNSATIGIPIFLGFDGGCIHDGYLAFPYFPASELAKDFFFILFQTLQAYAVAKARGMAQLNLNTGLVRQFPLGLPPLAEQHRIVAKVDELMVLCDRLETAEAERERRRDRLTAASLNRLSHPGDAGTPTFRENVQFHLRHLPRLTTRPDQISQLRQMILNLAVRGRLVPQDHNDKPASELLKRIESEKTRLVSEGRLKKQKSVPPPKADEGPFQIPEGWQWCRLGQTISLLGGFAYPSDAYVATSRNQVIRLGNVKNDKLLLDQKPVFIPDALAEQTEGVRIVANDILLTMTGTKAKRDYAFTALVHHSQLLEKRLYLNQRVGAIRSAIPEIVPLLAIFLKVEPLLDLIFETATGTANQGNIGTECVLNLPLPLPPLAEQHRIVAKVEELLALCGKLGTHLTTAQTESRHLLESVLHETLSAS